MSDIRRQVCQAYRDRWGEDPDRVIMAPGRVNLIGDHTDYSLLPVLPMAIQQGIAFAFGPAPSGVEINSLTEGAAVYVDASNRVTRIIEKPTPGTSTTPWNNPGFGVLGSAIWPHIDAIRPSPRGELEVADALTRLIEDGGDVTSVPVEGPWFDVGTPERLAEAERGIPSRE